MSPPDTASSDPGAAVVVLTAENAEYQAVRSHLTDLVAHHHPDGTIFEIGSLRDSACRVALAVTGEGNALAGVLAERAIATFRPIALLSVGTADALADDLRPGAVVVATRVYAYHGGREAADGFHARPRGWEAPHGLEQLARHVARIRGWVRRLPVDARDDAPAVQFRPVAAGEIVLDSDTSTVARRIHSHYDDAAAIERASAGAAHAAHLNQALPALAVRGIAGVVGGGRDPAGPAGSTAVAARNAAAFAIALVAALADRIPPPVADSPTRQPGTLVALPPPIDGFIGRDDEVRLVARSLRRGNVRVVITGTAGSGKSQLASVVAHRLADELDVVCWLPGRTPADLVAGLLTLGLDLQLPLAELDSDEDRLLVVGRWLTEHESWLLVVDDVTAAETLDRLVPADAPGRVLATSVSPAWPMGWTRVALGAMARADSIALLRVDGSDQAGVGRLLRTLGGLPLPLVEAAAFLAQTDCDVETYLGLLDRVRDTYALEATVNPARLTTLASVGRLIGSFPAAVDLLSLLAQFAPRQIPAALVADDRSTAVLPDSLRPAPQRDAAQDLLTRWNLVQSTGNDLFVHGETQAAVRQHLTKTGATGVWSAYALRAVDATLPENFDFVGDRHLGQVLVPHATRVAVRAVRLTTLPATAVSVLRRVSVYWQEVGAFSEAVQVLHEATAVADALPRVGRGRLFLELGRSLFARGDSAGAAAALASGAGVLAGCADPAEAKIEAELLNELGAVALHEGDLDECLRQQARALEILLRADPENAYVGAILNDLARSMESLADQREQAAEYYQLAIARFETEYGATHPWVATACGNYARLLHKMGRHLQARREAERALDIDKAHYGERHNKTAIRYNNLAPILQDLGGAAEAHRRLEMAIDIWKDLFGPRHPNIAAARSNLGRLLIENSQAELALAALNEAISIWQENFPTGHFKEAATQYHLAHAYRQLQEHELARAAARRTLDIETRVLGPQAVDLVSTLVLLANIENDAGATTAAAELLGRARAILDRNPAQPSLAGLVDSAARRVIES